MKRIIKRTVLMLLILVLLLPVLAPAAKVEAAAAYLNTCDYNSSAARVATQIDEFTEVALHFCAQGSFSEIALRVPSYQDNYGRITLMLYKWDGNYTATLAGEPLAGVTYTNFEDSSIQYLRFGSLGAGEYLFLVCDGRDTVGVWTINESYPGIEYYRDGNVANASLQASVCFDDAAAAGFGEITPENWDVAWQDGAPEQSGALDAPVDSSQWTLTDGLGRSFDTQSAEETGDKFVGMFYWAWHYKFTYQYAYNLNNLMLEYPEASNDYDNDIWLDFANSKAFWDEPVYGYYTSLDRWVIRRQAELLADAGVDVIVLDCTNGSYTWSRAYKIIADVYTEARADGVDTPKIAFMCNFATAADIRTQLKSLYTDFYSSEKYKDLWFWWEGKPLMLADKSALETAEPVQSAISEFFNFRKPDYYYFRGASASSARWGWLSVYPQTAYTEPDGTVEQITVGVAQNASEYGLVAMNDYRGGVYGRSYTNDPDYSYTYTTPQGEVTADKSADNPSIYGLNFQEQWDYAISRDPQFIFVTGWNEWVADRYETWQGSENAFPDQYNDEYSRDIEPTKGALKDYYYTQLAINIRRYKGSAQTAPEHEYTTIDIDGDLAQWDGVKAYYDYTDSYADRGSTGYYGRYYKNDTLRNDIVCAKTACDEDNVYFYVECADTLSDPYEENWMRLYIDTGSTARAWEGFEYAVGLHESDDPENYTTLESSTGGWKWELVGDVRRRIDGNVMVVCVPRSLIGMKKGSEVSFSFKWCDNNTDDGDIMSVYTDGDAAPGSRYAFAYANDGSAGNLSRNPFSDVPAGRWYTRAVLACNALGYMKGVSQNSFEPNTQMTRAMLVCTLAKLSGEDISGCDGGEFTDVAPGSWYACAVGWAAKKGITSGTGEGLFSPKAKVTREEAALFLYTFAAYSGRDTSQSADISGYADAQLVHGWAYNGVAWAVGAGLVSGRSSDGGTLLTPRQTLTRAESAQMIIKFRG